MYLYFGWTCQTPDCGEKIPYRYLGKDKIKLGVQIDFHGLLYGQCRKCGKVYEYSQRQPETLSFAKRVPSHQLPK